MKRIFSIFVVLCLVVTMIPVMVSATGNAVQVSTETDLNSAITNATDSVERTIQLTGDIPLTDTIAIPASKKIVLDLNGHILDGVGITTNNKSIIMNNGDLKIIDSDSDAQHSGTYNNLPAGGVLTGGKGTKKDDNTFGGAIYNNGILSLAGGTITKNEAQYGGAIFIAKTGNLSIENGTISDNCASSGYGGGIYCYGTIIMNGGSISNNDAQFGGGGVCLLGIMTMNNGTISYNKSRSTSSSGGGIRIDGATLNITGGTISNNTATDCGGGISYGLTPSTVNISGGNICDNHAGKRGAGIGLVNSKWNCQ